LGALLLLYVTGASKTRWVLESKKQEHSSGPRWGWSGRLYNSQQRDSKLGFDEWVSLGPASWSLESDVEFMSQTVPLKHNLPGDVWTKETAPNSYNSAIVFINAHDISW